MSSLRLEKGYRDMGVDIDNTDNPIEAGLGFTVAWDKPGGFVGRDALLAARAAGPPKQRVVGLMIEVHGRLSAACAVEMGRRLAPYRPAWYEEPVSPHDLDGLKANGTPYQLYFHRGGHGGAPPDSLINRWFTRYLWGVPNGVENEPKAWVVREANACPSRAATVVTSGIANSLAAIVMTLGLSTRVGFGSPST